MDKDGSNLLDYQEFVDGCGLESNLWSLRLFDLLDKNFTGSYHNHTQGIADRYLIHGLQLVALPITTIPTHPKWRTDESLEGRLPIAQTSTSYFYGAIGSLANMGPSFSSLKVSNVRCLDRALSNTSPSRIC